MDSRYKIVISNRNLYKEIELAPNAQQVKVGTATDCDIRLYKDLFFEQIELVFVKNDNTWNVLCSDNLYLTAGKGDMRKLITKVLSHGDTFEVKYQSADNVVFEVDFLIDFDNGHTKYDRVIQLEGKSGATIGASSGSDILLKSSFAKNDAIELSKQKGGLTLSIRKSTYGVYHNGKKASSGVIIKDGDFLSIADYFFFYKNDRLLTEKRNDIEIKNLTYFDLPDRIGYPKFNRNTRIKIALSQEPIEILDPPAIPQKPKNNLVTKLLPSMGMLLASGVMAFIGGAMIIMSLFSGVIAIVSFAVTIGENKKDYEQKNK